MFVVHVLLAVLLQELSRPLSSVQRTSLAEAMNSRWRATMEDAPVVVDEFGGDRDTGLFGVYDGHGGRNVAKYLQKHLHETIAAELHDKDARTVEECLKTAFLMTDIECAKTGEAASGSTAIVCIVRKEPPKSRGKPWKRYVFTANCGDARAVLCHKGAGVRLSHDHKASEAPEIRRIQAAGGFVTNGRVMGVLAVTRSFGDYALKKYVTCEPYTSTTKINEESQLLIIACDGVWDVLDDQEACNVVLEHCKATSASVSLEALQDSAAERLVRVSLDRGSRDKITAMVVFL
jgi:serine/threonine protein phosphatase PrpC